MNDRKPSGTWAPAPQPHTRDWDEASRDKDLSHPVDYDPRRTFSVGDVLVHEKFGIGIVLGVRENRRMYVAFRNSTRLLVHGLK